MSRVENRYRVEQIPVLLRRRRDQRGYRGGAAGAGIVAAGSLNCSAVPPPALSREGIDISKWPAAVGPDFVACALVIDFADVVKK